MTFQPAIKWSGSKRSQAVEIVRRIPNKEYSTYYEPFCGGCSILFQVLKTKNIFQRYVCSDVNGDLISLWNKIKESPDVVISKYSEMWKELNSNPDKEYKKRYFAAVRERFNQHRSPFDFMFIMRTTTNGMPRYNAKGDFNNSFHVTRDGINPKTLSSIIYDWAEVLNRNDVLFRHASYDAVSSTRTDFLYLDPPYANTKGMYYGTLDYSKFWEWIRKQDGDYILSFDGKTTSQDMTYDVPKDIYKLHEYLKSGNSSFRRVIGISSTEDVDESIYLSYIPEEETRQPLLL